MDDWSLPDLDSPINEAEYQFATYRPCHQGKAMQPPPPPPGVPNSMPPPRVPVRKPQPQTPQAQPSTSQQSNMGLHLQHYGNSAAASKGDNPREIRNRAEKMRRDRLNQSVRELASMVPPVVAARRKIDKTTVLRLTAHYLRAHQYVFGDSIGQMAQEFSPSSVRRILSLFNGFLITLTYRGIIVVVSQNVHEYLGYTELDLLGQNILNITHEDDRAMLKEQLMPKTQNLGPNGELLIPDEPGAKCQVEEALARDKKQFVVRFKKLGQRSEPCQYVSCHVEGSLRKSDRACGGTNRCCQMVRRVRARTENPCSSGNDIVFIGVVRPSSDTFINESALEGYRMEYRTRHSIDGQIIQCESRIALVTGYMTHEVSGMNAMNFMHRDDVRWVVIALREMYDQHRVYGESCYRLIAKNGQFIYMKTRGRLDVDKTTGACTSFVCTNTAVDEKEGKHLIRQMRKKFTMMVNSSETPAIQNINEDFKEENDDRPVPVEDPRRLEEVILHLVTNLPSPPPEHPNENTRCTTPEKCMSPHQHISIIPPKKEMIVSAIGKIYDVIKSLDKDHRVTNVAGNNDLQQEQRLLTPYDHQFASTSQDKVVEFVSNDPNKIFEFGQYSQSTFNSTMYSNGSELLNTEPLQTTTVSPDLGYFDNSTSNFGNISFILDQINENVGDVYNNQRQEFEPEFQVTEVTDPQINYFPMVRLPEQSNFDDILPEPSTSNITSGMKRPIEFENKDITFKKKITDVLFQQNEPTGLDSPSLESFFDESLFDAQIETAINSLDSIDPTFPDLLISADVQEILGRLETDQQDHSSPDLN